jgi:NAD-dependent SIR2 family protein deacetylase
MSEVVFILGAGASKEAGAPLMVDFLEKADELRKSNRAGENAGELKPDFDAVFNVISALQPVHSKSELDLDNIESVFAAFEMGRLINRLPDLSKNNSDSLLLSMKRLIYKTLEKTILYPVRNNHVYPPNSYHKFAELITKLNADANNNRCSIITFNYDIALDYALSFNTHPANYCLSENFKQGHINLFKLHGSLNWAKCSKCGEIVPLTIQNYFQKYHFPFLHDAKSVCLDFASKLSSSGLMHCQEYIKSEPLIVPPTWNKMSYQQDLSKVWSHAASELTNAESIFVLGYSLPDSDLFFRYFFALGSVGPTRIKRFWVFDPDKERVLPRFQNLVGAGTKTKFSFHALPFSEAINFIAQNFQ